jgi:hypothetical protein
MARIQRGHARPRYAAAMGGARLGWPQRCAHQRCDLLCPVLLDGACEVRESFGRAQDPPVFRRGGIDPDDRRAERQRTRNGVAGAADAARAPAVPDGDDVVGLLDHELRGHRHAHREVGRESIVGIAIVRRVQRLQEAGGHRVVDLRELEEPRCAIERKDRLRTRRNHRIGRRAAVHQRLCIRRRARRRVDRAIERLSHGQRRHEFPPARQRLAGEELVSAIRKHAMQPRRADRARTEGRRFGCNGRPDRIQRLADGSRDPLPEPVKVGMVLPVSGHP